MFVVKQEDAFDFKWLKHDSWHHQAIHQSGDATEQPKLDKSGCPVSVCLIVHPSVHVPIHHVSINPSIFVSIHSSLRPSIIHPWLYLNMFSHTSLPDLMAEEGKNSACPATQGFDILWLISSIHVPFHSFILHHLSSIIYSSLSVTEKTKSKRVVVFSYIKLQSLIHFTSLFPLQTP